MSEPVVIRAEHLARHFGPLVAVRDVSLTVHKGEIFGVLGANGAGKSTTVRMLTGLLDPTSGSATVVGFDVARHPDEVKKRIGYMTQAFSLYKDLTVRENLSFYGAIYGLRGRALRDRIRAAMHQAGLTDRARQLAGTLSGGWRQRLALACATLHEPQLLFLDEPTAGVDPVSRREFWDRIHRLASEGTTILVTTHYMDEAERCHRLAFIFRGSVLDIGSPAEILERRALRVAELVVPGDPARAREAAEELRHEPRVEEVSHYGGVVRVATHHKADPVEVVHAVLGDALPAKEVRATIEDAFVSMVREDARDAAEGAEA